MHPIQTEKKSKPHRGLNPGHLSMQRRACYVLENCDTIQYMFYHHLVKYLVTRVGKWSNVENSKFTTNGFYGFPYYTTTAITPLLRTNQLFNCFMTILLLWVRNVGFKLRELNSGVSRARYPFSRVW